MNPTQRLILDYEIRSSWWASWMGTARLQRLTGRYFAWKVNRKFARYQNSLAERRRVLARENADRLNVPMSPIDSEFVKVHCCDEDGYAYPSYSKMVARFKELGWSVQELSRENHTPYPTGGRGHIPHFTAQLLLTRPREQ